MKSKYEEQKLLQHVYSDSLDEALLEGNAIIAGGAITSVFTGAEVNDLDVYFKSWEDLGNFLYAIEDTCVRVLNHTDKAILLTDGGNQIVQAIIFDVFPTIEELFEKFDFTVVMGAYDYSSRHFYFHQDFMKHNSQRVLSFNPETLFPIVSALRVDKYIKKGYKISKAEFLRIVMKCMTLGLESFDDVRKNIGGLYGLDMKKVIVDDGEFSLENVIEQLSKSLTSEHDVPTSQKVNEIIHVPNWTEFVYDMTKTPMKIFKWGNKFSSNKFMVEQKKIDERPERYELIDCPVDTSKIYKYVLKNDGRYFSHYARGFEYIPNEGVSAKNGELFFVYLPGIDTATFRNVKDAVLVECLYEKDDIVSFPSVPSGVLTVKKARMVREVPQEEVDDIKRKWNYIDMELHR